MTDILLPFSEPIENFITQMGSCKFESGISLFRVLHTAHRRAGCASERNEPPGPPQ